MIDVNFRQGIFMRATLFLFVSSLVFTVGLLAQAAASDPRKEVEAFNRQLENATRGMDNSALMALWAEDGVSLLPSSKPLVGKPAIAAFLNQVTAQLEGARMEQFDLQCSGIEITGNWASEWCEEHQVVLLTGGKPPFNGRGRMLFVLHKGMDGNWEILREMWNQA